MKKHIKKNENILIVCADIAVFGVTRIVNISVVLEPYFSSWVMLEYSLNVAKKKIKTRTCLQTFL